MKRTAEEYVYQVKVFKTNFYKSHKKHHLMDAEALPTHDKKPFARDVEQTRANDAKEVFPEFVYQHMATALQQAELALHHGEVPVGCVFVYNGAVISSGYNLTNQLKNGTAHAEIVSINKVISEGTYDVSVLEYCDLYVTCEPCIMCAAALSKVGVRHVYFGCHNDRFGGNGSVLDIHTNSKYGTPHQYDVTAGVLKEEAIEMFRRFYSQTNTGAPEAKRRKKGDSEECHV